VISALGAAFDLLLVHVTSALADRFFRLPHVWGYAESRGVQEHQFGSNVIWLLLVDTLPDFPTFGLMIFSIRRFVPFSVLLMKHELFFLIHFTPSSPPFAVDSYPHP